MRRSIGELSYETRGGTGGPLEQPLGRGQVVVPATDNDVLDDDEEEEAEVFEVELGGGSSPWATALLECASEGNLETVKVLLDEGKVELDDVDVDGFTALMIAAAEGRTHVAMELLRRGADVSVRTHEMRSTALHFAAKSGVAEVVEAICTRDPQSIDCQNFDGDTPLVWACTEGRVDAVRVLVKYNADVNVVSHRAMSTLICTVMLRDEDDGGSDADRAAILRVLLTKNRKLVNYQDRDGSTAMHLAASHGYLECVKALLEFGADITLRNAIGQTPLEEAQDTGVPECAPCIDYLRDIWKRLEEEAAARMMSMLEMEESLASSNPSNGSSRGKKSKKKQKKAKRKAAKSTNALDSATTAPPTEATSSGDESSGDERGDKVAFGVQTASQDAPLVQLAVDEAKDDTGAWTTVGRKQKVTEAPKTESEAPAIDDLSQPSSEKRSPHTKVVPVVAPVRTPPKSVPQADIQVSTKSTPAAPNATSPTIPPAPTPAVPPFPESVGSPFSTFQTISHSSRLYERYAMPQAPAIDRLRGFTGGSVTWRGSSELSSLPNSPSLTAEASTTPLPSLSSASIWKHASSMPSERLSRPSVRSNSTIGATRRRWTHDRIQRSSESVQEVLEFLACGICGELVNDNVQCGSSQQCPQLYCAACLMRAMSVSPAGFKCTRCHHVVDPKTVQRNEFAQAQAAALGLASRSHSRDDEQPQRSLAEMKRHMDMTSEKAVCVDLDPFHLAPGADLTTLSNGQLDVLEEMHEMALRHIMATRLEIARAQERLRIEEWLKTRRDLLQFTSPPSAMMSEQSLQRR
ncbi:hypothetical protein Poli38472_007467 [Pythium oligandrum]|uniref:Uncharacterized protein n=1 Tax=Pythium oligandrum TaxID=41045 RepID=A0A8K1CQQ7_PYTOL|nr:hypothetical protein Poli38472_007467 [Pythium oligandrum]|eukprot:TMW67795.1 hypothetical protein Poli38472_007467 [Pythium oligandrum]